MTRYLSLCMRCVRWPSVTMLSGYVIRAEHCENCGYRSDLALCKVVNPW